MSEKGTNVLACSVSTLRTFWGLKWMKIGWCFMYGCKFLQHVDVCLYDSQVSNGSFNTPSLGLPGESGRYRGKVLHRWC